MSKHDGFHDGERTMQARAGETAIADRNSVMLKNHVIGGARPFIAQQFMVAVGSMDADGAPWASLLFGRPGFLHAEDGESVQIDLPAHERDAGDPLWTNIAAGHDVGLLFIELGSRRRYRVNGTVDRLDRQGVEVAVREAFPNCPKYIQRRQLRRFGDADQAGQPAQGTLLHGAAERIVAQADTLFVASRHAGSGTDVSHRGGGRGFVKMVDATTLRIPDYQGNSMFNTLGNIEADGRAGLCIPDFENGRLLQLTGKARVRWDLGDPNGATGGTGRWWEFEVERWILRETPQRLAWEYVDASPFNPAA